MLNHNSSSIQQNDTHMVKTYGHFANNQIKDNVVSWIEDGMWNLDIVKESNNNNNNRKE
jgi:hypothetical protein